MRYGLLSTTALCHPKEICRDPVTLGSAILGGLGVTGASAALTTIVGYAAGFAINLVASYALQALQKRGGADQEQGRLVNARSSVAPEEYVYGQIRKGGTVTYLEGTGDDNKYLHMIIVLAAHEVEEIGDIYINDEVVTLAADAGLGGGPDFVTGDKWRSKIRIKKYDGSQTTADPDLVAESNTVDANFVGRGLAYLYVRLEDDREVFTGGVPNFTAVVKGKKVFDPRDGQTRWTRNLALNLRDYLTSSYGVKASTSKVGNAIWQTAANVCDEAVALNGGGSEVRYHSDVIIRSSETRRSVLNKFMASSAGTIWYGNEWLFKPGYYTSPVGDLDINSLRGPIQVNPRPRRRQRFNIVHGTFVSAVDDYVDTDFPEIKNTTYVAQDNGHERYLNLSLGYTSSNATAQRIADQTLNRSREGITFTAPFKFADAVEYTVGDVIRFTEAAYGWLNKEFEVKKWNFRFARDKTPEVEMVLQETSSAAFAWGNNEQIISGNNTTLPSFSTVPPPVIGQPTTQLLRLQGGSELPAVVFDWTQTGSASEVDHYVVEWRDNFNFATSGGVQDFDSLTTTRQQAIYVLYVNIFEREPDVDGLAFWDASALTLAQIETSLKASSEATNPVPYTQHTVTDVLQDRILGGEIGDGLDIKIRARNGLGRFSTPTIRSYIIEDDTEALPPPTNISSTVAGLNVRLEFTRPTQYASGFPAYDFSEVEVWRHTTNSLAVDGSGEPTQGTRVGATSDDFFPDTVPADDDTYYYFLRSVDYSGNKSAFTAAETVIVPANTGSLDGITTIVEKPSVPVFVSAAGAEDYTQTDTEIAVLEGNTYLNFTTSTSLAAGQWRIFDTDVFATSSNDLSVGSIVDGGNVARVNDHSNFDTNNNNAITVGYDIQVRRLDGSYVTLTVMQTVFLSVEGAEGQQGQQGNTGTQGPQGDTGDPGADALFGSIIPRTTNTITKDANGVYSGTFVRFDVEFRQANTIVAADRFRLDRSGDGWSGSVVDESHPSTVNPTRLSTSLERDGQNATVTVTYSFGGQQASVTFPMTVIINGQDGDEGAVGDTGDIIVAGVVYFQTLQSSAPSKPSASGYNTTTGLLTGLTGGWAETQPPVAVSDTSVQEWKSTYLVRLDGETEAVVGTIEFSNPVGAIQIATDMESDNYVAGSAGWKLERDTGNLEANDGIFRGNLIANDLTITGRFDAADIVAEGSATQIGIVETNFGAGGSGSFENELNLTMTFDDPVDVMMVWNIIFDVSSLGSPEWGYRLRRGGSTSSGGTTIESETSFPTHAAGAEEMHTGMAVVSLSAGTYTFRFDSWMTSNGGDLDTARMAVVARMV